MTPRSHARIDHARVYICYILIIHIYIIYIHIYIIYIHIHIIYIHIVYICRRSSVAKSRRSARSLSRRRVPTSRHTRRRTRRSTRCVRDARLARASPCGARCAGAPSSVVKPSPRGAGSALVTGCRDRPRSLLPLDAGCSCGGSTAWTGSCSAFLRDLRVGVRGRRSSARRYGVYLSRTASRDCLRARARRRWRWVTMVLALLRGASLSRSRSTCSSSSASRAACSSARSSLSSATTAHRPGSSPSAVGGAASRCRRSGMQCPKYRARSSAALVVRSGATRRRALTQFTPLATSVARRATIQALLSRCDWQRDTERA